MALTRGSSILDMAEAAMKRLGAQSSPAGISPDRVRILMAQQAKLFANVEMPKAKIPERALKPLKNKNRINEYNKAKRRKEVVEKWLAIPEPTRTLSAFCRIHKMHTSTLVHYLNMAGLEPYSAELRASIVEAYKTKKMGQISEEFSMSLSVIHRMLVDAGVTKSRNGKSKSA
jgi:hypothetical protein